MKSVITASSRKRQKRLMLWLAVTKIIESTRTTHTKCQKHNDIIIATYSTKSCVKQVFKYQKRCVTISNFRCKKALSTLTSLFPRYRDGNPGDKWSRVDILAANTDGFDFWFILVTVNLSRKSALGLQ